jgi:CHAD domain-containing protein
MLYCFQRRESVREGFHRIARVEVDAVLAALATEGGPDVHEARKHIKMLRALVHLFRNGLDEERRETAVDAMRELAHALAPSRDADVRLETFSALIARSGSDLPKGGAGVRKHLEAEARGLRGQTLDAEDLERAREMCGKIREQMAGMEPKHGGWRAMAAGLRRAYHNGRKAAEKPIGALSDEDRHEWRRDVKDLWNFARILARVQPKKMQQLIHELDALAELLGDDRDLSLLDSYLRERGWLTEGIEKLIHEGRDSAYAELSRLGGVLYEEKPKEFVDRMGKWWRGWR